MLCRFGYLTIYYIMYNNNIIRNSVTEGCACGWEIRQEYQIISARSFCGGHRISLRITTRALTLKANCNCDRVSKKSQNPRQRSPTRIRFDIFFFIQFAYYINPLKAINWVPSRSVIVHTVFRYYNRVSYQLCYTIS